MKANIGKTKISVEACGCIICGTQWSSAWFLARQIEVVISKKRGLLDINICADCRRSKENE